MVLDKIFGSDKEKDVEELDQEIDDISRELLKIEGEERKEALKKSKRRELADKKRELKKKKLKQTRAGKVLSSIGEGLENISEKTEDSETSQVLDSFASDIEKIDGDGKGDTRASLGIGIDEPDKRDLNIEGDLNVEGDVESGAEDVFGQKSGKSSRTGTLSDDMKDIVGVDE